MFHADPLSFAIQVEIPHLKLPKLASFEQTVDRFHLRSKPLVITTFLVFDIFYFKRCRKTKRINLKRVKNGSLMTSKLESPLEKEDLEVSMLQKRRNPATL